MSEPAGVPAVTQQSCQAEVEATLAIIRDLGLRAAALEALIHTARVPEPPSGGLVAVRLNETAWWWAVQLATTPRPEGVRRSVTPSEPRADAALDPQPHDADH